MKLIDKISRISSQKEPYAGGFSYDQQIKAGLPFLKLIPKKKKRVLVVGCGEGYEVKWLADHNFDACGITKNKQEVKNGTKKYGVKLYEGDMHQLPFDDSSFDCVYASNVLEHSVAPFVALTEWRRVLKNQGWLVMVMPSKEWLGEYYHYSVLTHSQCKELFNKTGYDLLAAPELKPKISYNGGDIFYDLGRCWGHYDGYVCQKAPLSKIEFKLDSKISLVPKRPNILRDILKYPYNIIRVWYARNHHE